VPANIHAAAALQRTLILNDRIWHSEDLKLKASKLLTEIENGINTFGIVKGKSGEPMYAYEVDGLGNILGDFDDANIPSLLSIPLLGWDGYNKEAYANTRNYLLSKSNKSYFEGSTFKGIGSPHTPQGYIWPMAMVIQGLTDEGPDLAEKMVFQMRQLLMSAKNDAMHESVYKESPNRLTRAWFEWVSRQSRNASNPP
jgi:meiotically up-regulated gene 157 (Mug157) protein